MTGKEQFADDARNPGRSPGNLGQKKAEKEEAADEKLDHMGDNARRDDKTKERKDKPGKRAG